MRESELERVRERMRERVNESVEKTQTVDFNQGLAIVRFKATSQTTMDLDLGHRSIQKIETIYRIKSYFSDIKPFNYLLSSEIHPS